MKIEEISSKLRETKETLNLEYMKSELQRRKNSAENLRRTLSKLDHVLRNVKRSKEMNDELKQIGFDDRRIEDKINMLSQEILKVSRLNDADQIVDTVSQVDREVSEVIKDIETARNRAMEELRKRLDEINRSLKIFARIFNQLLEEDMEISTFYSSSSSVLELNDKVREAETHLKEVKEVAMEKIKEMKMDENSLTIITKLMDEGKVRINRNNYADAIKIIKLLIEKGIQMEMSL